MLESVRGRFFRVLSQFSVGLSMCSIEMNSRVQYADLVHTLTQRTQTAGRIKAPLTDLENAVMRAVWEFEPFRVESVYCAVSRDRDLKETTLRTLLRRLEQKGYLRHGTQGRAYVYRATEDPHHLAARAVRQIIDRFCEGSVEVLLRAMIDTEMLSTADLTALKNSFETRRMEESNHGATIAN